MKTSEETIDVTPTWEAWFNMAAISIENGVDPVKAFRTLKPDFEKMAKLATMKIAEMKEVKELPLTDEQLENVFVTALEGGSNYWYYLPDVTVDCLETYLTPERSELYQNILIAVRDGAILGINDAEDIGESLGVISTQSIKKGLEIAQRDYPERIQEVTDEDYDAETADVLFQLIVLGEVTFG